MILYRFTTVRGIKGSYTKRSGKRSDKRVITSEDISLVLYHIYSREKTRGNVSICQGAAEQSRSSSGVILLSGGSALDSQHTGSICMLTDIENLVFYLHRFTRLQFILTQFPGRERCHSRRLSGCLFV